MPKLEEVTIRGGFHEGEMSVSEFGELGWGVHRSDGRVISQSEMDGRLDPGEGNADYLIKTSEPAPTVTSPARLPSLKRLHVISPTPFEHLIRKIQPFAPSLSHIRLSDLQANDYGLVRTIFSELVERDVVPSVLPRLHERQWSAIPTALPVDWAPIIPRPDVLRKLILQPSAPPPKPEKQCGCCSGYYQVDDMTRLLREMARESEGDMFVFLPAGHHEWDSDAPSSGLVRDGYSYEEALRSWSDTACGAGKGCWTEKDEVNIDVVCEDAGEDTGWEEMFVERRGWTVDRSVLRYLLEKPKQGVP